MTPDTARIHIFIGTKAQYIKTAPVIWELEDRGTPYRLIDSGQHGAFSRELRRELRVREPDYSFGGHTDIASIGTALLWSLQIFLFIFAKRRLRTEVFPNGGFCLVHGDTPSTLLAALLARRAGLKVAHLEAGLRSFSYLNPFPEELIRVLVMKMSDVLFAPSAAAEENLKRMKVRGSVVASAGNTIAETLGNGVVQEEGGRPVVTVHRVENLHRRPRLVKLLEILRGIAEDRQVLFVVHPPTRRAIEKNALGHMLEHPSIETTELLPHAEFVANLRRAPFVITDGGSIQEECALIGVPTLLWRRQTERSDGLGENVVLSRFDDRTIATFLRDPARHRRTPAHPSIRPSSRIVDHLTEAH